MATEMRSAMSVDFPLRGEWVAFNSPGDRVPSHGTDMLGQRFAYDFIRVDRRKGWHVHPAGSWRSNLIGFPVDECYAWGQPVHMPFDGEIIEVKDGYPERSRVVPIREIAIVLKNALTFESERSLQPVVGNHVIARAGDLFAVFAHLTTGSVAVDSRADGWRRRGHRSRGSYRQFNRTAPPLPADGWAGHAYRKGRSVRVQRARSRAERWMEACSRRRPATQDRIRRGTD